MEHDQLNELLLTTKLTIPTHHHRITPRPALYEQLDQSLQHSLILITAPAGFGKTRLISDWLKRRQIASTWLSLEEADNNLSRFWRYCIAALELVQPELMSTIEKKQAPLQQHDIEALLISIINALAHALDDVLLILDNYHTITDPIIHQTLNFLIEHLPPRLHLLISTRTPPPIPLARARVQGQLIEFRAAQLRFTIEETSAFLVQSMQLPLSQAMIAELGQRTQGWIAGLQLATFALQEKKQREDFEHFIRTFNGTNQYVVHYLADEVFLPLSAEMQEFLLYTSILEKLNTSLCKAVTHMRNSKELLEYLDQANLFLLRLENQPDWYRYDPLFSEFLQYRLKQQQHPILLELYKRASDWFYQQKMYIDAIKYLLLANNYEKAANLIAQEAWAFIRRGEEQMVYGWLSALPETMIETQPMLSFLYACTLIFHGQLEDFEHHLDNAEEQWQKQQNVSMLSRAYDLRATMDLLSGNGKQAVMHAKEALHYLPEEHAQTRSSILVNLGAGYYLCGNLTEAHQTLMASYHLSQHYRHSSTLLATTTYLGKIQMAKGDLRAALQTFQQMLSEADEGLLTYTISTHIHLADIYREWNDLIGAEEHSQEALRLIEQSHYNGLAITHCALVAARLASMRGNHEQAEYFFDQADQNMQHGRYNKILQAQSLQFRIQYLLGQHKHKIAQQWFQHYTYGNTFPTETRDGEVYEQEALVLSKARLLNAQDQPEEAIIILRQIYDSAHQQERVESQLAILLSLTLAYQARGNTQQTLQTLEQALSLGEVGGYTRMFVDEGDKMSALLTEVYSRYQRKATNEFQNIAPGYIYTLLSAFGEEAQPPLWSPLPQHDDILIDKLSEREYTVLCLIAEGLSNQEIAQKLVVTVSTIKTHLNNIYAKLHVHTRLQAVTKAYDLGLLRHTEIETEPLSRPRSSETQ